MTGDERVLRASEREWCGLTMPLHSCGQGRQRSADGSGV